MGDQLEREEVALLIKARQLLNAKGLSKDADIKRICESAGVSRKTGYQWARDLQINGGDPGPEEELAQLKADYEDLKKRFKQVDFENEGRKLAWEIHEVDALLAAKKKHHTEAQKEKAVSFFRDKGSPIREVAWVLNVSLSVLSQWNQSFDEHMKPYRIPENRGKASKVTAETVKTIVKAAEELKANGKRLRIKGFTTALEERYNISLSWKTVKEVLIANNLYQASTKKKRPRFYQSLRKEIPNGLLSLDGSEMVIFLDKEAYTFNVELSVDVGTFDHTAFSVGDSETSDEVIKVLEAHCKKWGSPLGVLCDSGSANLSEKAMVYLKDHEIDLIPVGPANPKGNGTDEGAFSQMKDVLGPIHLNFSSPRALARSVLEKLISVYMIMRNRIPVKGKSMTPDQCMTISISESQRDDERQRLREHVAAKARPEDEQVKVDRLHGLVRYYDIKTEPEAMNRAERTIAAYEKEAIIAAEEAFIKAVNRKAERKNLPYFFGILRRIQQERDNEVYKRYCYQRYNEQVMLNLERQQQEEPQGPSMDNILSMLVQAVRASTQFVKDLAIRKAREWTLELMASYRYPGALKKRFSDALGNFKDLSLEQKTRIWELIEQFLSPKTTTESVTHF